MEEVEDAVTRRAVTGNVAVRDPAGTTTTGGTVATDVRLLAMVTVVPPGGAAPDRVTVPVACVPPTTVLGLSVTEDAVAARRERVSVRDADPWLAITFTEVVDGTGEVAIGKLDEVAPAAMTTLAGGDARVPVEVRRVTTVGVPTDALRRTVPVVAEPPVSVVGEADRVKTRTARAALRVTPPAVAEIVVEVAVTRGWAAIGNVALVVPGATTTFAGTEAPAGLLLARATTVPPAGAAADSVTVPTTAPPATALVPESTRVASAGVATVSDADAAVAPSVAERTTAVGAATGVVVKENVPALDPDGMVTDGGTMAAGWLDESARVAPPNGAAPFRVMVPVPEDPPRIDAGLTERLETPSGRSVTEPVADVPPAVAVTMTGVEVETTAVERTNGTLVAPAGTATSTGKPTAEGTDEESWTVVPGAPAAAPSVTSPCTEEPPMTEEGESESDDTPAGAGITRSEATAGPPGKAAVMEAVASARTTAVEMAKSADVAPAGIVADPGTDATAGSLLDRRTVTPAAPAADASRSVPFRDAPPVTLAEASERVPVTGEAEPVTREAPQRRTSTGIPESRTG